MIEREVEERQVGVGDREAHLGIVHGVEPRTGVPRSTNCPTSMRFSRTRPANGARSSVRSRSRRACASDASASRSVAAATRDVFLASSWVVAAMRPSFWRRTLRSRLRRASSAWLRAAGQSRPRRASAYLVVGAVEAQERRALPRRNRGSERRRHPDETPARPPARNRSLGARRDAACVRTVSSTASGDREHPHRGATISAHTSPRDASDNGRAHEQHGGDKDEDGKHELGGKQLHGRTHSAAGTGRGDRPRRTRSAWNGRRRRRRLHRVPGDDVEQCAAR